MPRPFSLTNAKTRGGGSSLSARAKAVLGGHLRLIVSSAALLVLIVVSIVGYNFYLDNKLYAEGTLDIATTYRQTAKAFSLFAQRNFNYLSDLDNYLTYLDQTDDLGDQLATHAARNNNWGYSDVFLFNQGRNYRTMNSRTGTDGTSGALDQLYEDGEPLVASYISSSGVRRVVYARLLTDPVEVDGIAYTGIAVSYDNSYLQASMDSGAYGENGDCYVVKQDGDVVFALESKSVIEDFVVNINDYLAQSASFERGDGASLASSIAVCETGHALVSVGGKNAYVVSVASGVDGLSLVAVVRGSAVDAKIVEVRNVTTCVLAAVLLAVAGVALWLLYGRLSRELEQKESAREDLDRKNEQTLQLFRGIAGVFDRFAVCDLVNDAYTYEERVLGTPLYPSEGSYRDLVTEISRDYELADADAGNGRTAASYLMPGHLRGVLGGGAGYASFEYVSKERGETLQMNVVPVGWELDGSVSKVLLFAQNIDTKVELEALAKTDGLTGLLNQRSLADLLVRLHDKKRPYTLYFIDLDRFKQVNDTYGHDAGDKLLQEVAYRLRSCVRASDYVFRLGGDEFAVVTPGEHDARFSAILSARVERSVCEAVVVDGNELFVGMSCGYAGFPEEGAEPAEIQALADARMYERKRAHHESR